MAAGFKALRSLKEFEARVLRSPEPVLLLLSSPALRQTRLRTRVEAALQRSTFPALPALDLSGLPLVGEQPEPAAPPPPAPTAPGFSALHFEPFDLAGAAELFHVTKLPCCFVFSRGSVLDCGLSSR